MDNKLNANSTSSRSSSSKSKSKSSNHKNAFEKSIHLNDVFGSRYSFDDDLDTGTAANSSSRRVTESRKSVPKVIQKANVPRATTHTHPSSAAASFSVSTNTTTINTNNDNNKPNNPSFRQRKNSPSGIHHDSKEKEIVVDLFQTPRSASTSQPDHHNDCKYLEGAVQANFNNSFFQDEHEHEHEYEYNNDRVNRKHERDTDKKITTNTTIATTTTTTTAALNKEEESLPLNILTNNQIPIIARIPKSKREMHNRNTQRYRATICSSFGICIGSGMAFLLLSVVPMWIMDPKPTTTNDINSSSSSTTLTPKPTPNPTRSNNMTIADLGKLPKSTIKAIQMIKNKQVTPQFDAYMWLRADAQWQTYTIQRRQVRFILATLYFATNPPFQHSWKNTGQWLSYNVHECLWLYKTTTVTEQQQYGYDLCNRTTQSQWNNDATVNTIVTALPLEKNNLAGTLPATELALFKNLQKVHLNNNPRLQGRIPDSWCQTVQKLQFDCINNNNEVTEGGGGLCGCDCKCS